MSKSDDGKSMVIRAKEARLRQYFFYMRNVRYIAKRVFRRRIKIKSDGGKQAKKKEGKQNVVGCKSQPFFVLNVYVVSVIFSTRFPLWGEWLDGMKWKSSR